MKNTPIIRILCELSSTDAFNRKLISVALAVRNRKVYWHIYTTLEQYIARNKQIWGDRFREETCISEYNRQRPIVTWKIFKRLLHRGYIQEADDGNYILSPFGHSTIYHMCKVWRGFSRPYLYNRGLHPTKYRQALEWKNRQQEYADRCARRFEKEREFPERLTPRKKAHVSKNKVPPRRQKYQSAQAHIAEELECLVLDSQDVE